MTMDGGSDSRPEEQMEDMGNMQDADFDRAEDVGEPQQDNSSGGPELDRSVPPELADDFEAAQKAEADGAEEGIQAWQALWGQVPGHPLIVDALFRLYEQTGKWHGLADFLKKNSNLVADEMRKINALMMLARVYDEHLNQDVMVVNTYQSVLKVREDFLPAIDAAVAKYESMNRWPDLVKMLKAKGQVVKAKEEKVEIFLKVAQLFLQRFSNQAEAIKAFEEVLEADPHHDQAIEFLKEMYEKRRDWEKLIGVIEKEADKLPEGPEKVDALVQIAEMATERLKRPNICIERWEAVLFVDPENEAALSNLTQFYERAKEWEKLADVLKKQLDFISDPEQQSQALQKLGQIFGDKLGNDAKAVEAWKALLELSPDDRRAQEQLKKKYLALGAWEELEAFYAQSEKWDEFIRVLEREAGRDDVETSARIEMHFKIAELWREKKERIDRAAKAYEDVLQLDPNNLRAAEALIPIVEEDKKNPEKLADFLEVRLGHLEDEDEALTLRRRIARIAEEEIGDFDRAFEGFLAVFRQRPGDDEFFDDLERTAGKAGHWERVIDAYSALESGASEKLASELMLRRARVLLEEMGRAEEALALYDKILKKEPKNPRAIAALEKIYAQMGRYEELLEIYAKRLEMAESDDERKEILYNQALLWEEEVQDSAKSIAVYLQIIDMAGDERRALAALDRLYVQEERWEELADIIQRELDEGTLEQDEELELKYRLGQVCNTRLGKKGQALECFREIVLVDTHHDKARSALEGLLEDDNQQAEAARILSSLYQEDEEWEKLLRVIEILAKRSADTFEAFEYLMRVGDIASQYLGSPERAFAGYSRAFQRNPADERALENLEEITTVLDSWPELVALLEKGASVAQDTAVSQKLWMRAAQIHDTQLDSVDDSVNAFKNVLEVEPGNLEAVSCLEQLYARTERWEELVGILRKKADIIHDVEEKEAVFRQMAMIYEEMLSRPEDAVTCLKEILALDPASESALQSLDTLFVQLRRWSDLADNLQQQLALKADPDESVKIKLRLAQLRRDKLQETGAAIEIYREVLEIDMENREAISSLEEILELDQFKRDAADILEPIYRALGEWQKLIGVYQILIETEEVIARKIELLHEIAQLYETAGDEPEKAFRTLARGIELDPSDERTQEDLERLARVLVLYDDLAVIYTKTAEDIANSSLAAAYHMKIARIQEEQLQDMPKAIEHYRKVLDIDPLHLEAATALERAYQVEEDYQALATTYLRKVDMVTDLEEQKEILFKASQIYEEILEEPEKAIRVYNRVLDLDEDDLQAISQLEGLYLRMERWEELQEIYNRKVDLVQTPEEKREVLYILGAMYEREVNDTEKAIATYQRILEFEPDDMQAIQRLDILYSETEEWHDLLSVLEREVELAEDPEEAVAFKYRIGELYVRHLNDVQRAIEYFRDILMIFPDHRPSIQLLEELVSKNIEPMAIAEVLEPLYRDLVEWRKLVDLFEVKLGRIEDPWQRVELQHQMAEILESDLHLDAPGEAFDVYARALKDDNGNEKTLSSLENLAAQTGRWDDLARLIDAQLEDVVEADRAIQLGLRCGAIYEGKLDRPDEAIDRYKKVLEFDPENRPAIIRLDQLFEVQERWAELATILQKEALIADDPEKSLELLFRQGRIYQTELENVDKAVEIYRDILAAEPTHEQSAAALELLFAEGVKRFEISEVLEPLYRMQGEWQRLFGLYEAQLEDISDVAERVSMLQRIAEIQEDKILDPVEAFNWYCRAFSEDPYDERSAEEIERLASSADMWTELADVYEELLSNRQETEVRVLCAKKLARVAEDELHDVARAEKAYRRCLELGADDLDVLGALDRIYTQYMEWERLVEILGRLADIVPSDVDKVEAIHRMGTVYESQLDEYEKARRCFHRIVDDLDPGHTESLEHLEVIYADLEQWSDLYNIYARMKDATSSESAQADLFAKMAVIASECLDDVPKAVELWGNVLDIRGEDGQALEALGDLYSQQENWSDLVDVLERAVAIAGDDETRIRLYSQLGLVWGECLQRDRSALENWENVLSIDFENITALKAISGIHEKNQDWGQLIETLERIVDVGASVFEPEELKYYFSKLGRIFAETMDQPFDAIENWKKAHDIDPSDLEPITALEKLFEEQEMWEESVAILGRKAPLLEADDQLETWLRQAFVFEEKLLEPLRAKESYEKIISVAPLHETAFSKLVAILEEEGAWGELTELYMRRLNYLADEDVRVRTYHAIADIYTDRLAQPESAFIVMQKAFEEDYSNDETAKRLERLASVTGKWEELLASCHHVLQTVQDQNVQINLCLKIGKWYADELDRPDYSLAYYQQVLQIDPENVDAARYSADLYLGTQQWPELVEALTSAVEFEKIPDKKKEFLVELGDVYETKLEDLEQARLAYNQALEIDPGLEAAINALERILGISKNWTELIPILRRKIEVLNDPEDIVSTRMRIGGIFEEELSEPQSAIDEYRLAVDMDPAHLPALRGLERLYQSLERWQDLLDILEVELDYATSERERITLLGRIARMLVEEFVKPDKAAERYEQILEIDPHHEESLVALEKIYRQAGSWHDFIATLEKHIDSVQDREQRIGLYKQVGETFATELSDFDRAIDAYNSILDINPNHESALDELAKIQAKIEDWPAAHDTLQRLAQTVEEPARKVDLYYRLGVLNEENLLDRAAATEHFRSALDVDSGHLPSLSALRHIHIEEGEWVAAARVLEAEQEHTQNARTRSKLQFDLGNLQRHRLGDEEAAVTWFERALESDPDNQAAAEPLVDVYIEAGKWQQAEPLLEMLIRLGGKRPAAEMQPLHNKLGLVADKLGDLEKAKKAYHSAYEIDAQHLPTVMALADVYYRAEDWDKAFKSYQTVLVHHRDKQSKQEIVEIFFRLGHIKAQLKERRKALNMFDKALEINPDHQPTLKKVIALHEEQSNFEQVIHYKKILMETVSDDERFDLLIEIGDIWHTRLNNPQKAISSYNEAAEIKPDSRPTLHKLLPLYQSTKQWPKVVEIIDRVASMEEDTVKLGRLYYSMGVIYRDEIKSHEDAVECFNKSLDASLENLKAFEAIDRILTQRKDWKNLERNYRKMLHRIAGKDRKDLEINLYHFLGEIYRTRMRQFEPAVEAFKIAAKLDPENAIRHEILAELYLQLPGRLQDAVDEHQWLIRKNPYRVESYKALRKLYFDNKQWDKAWCLCATLVFLKKADGEEQQFFEQYRTRGMVRAQARLDNERWIKDLFHEEESVYVGKVFESVTNAVRSLKVRPIKDFGLKKNQKRPINDTMTFSKTFFYASQVMNLPVIPDLYIQESMPGGLNFAITDPMATVCGASLLSGYSPQDLLFIVGKHLTYYRPEHYIRWVLPTHGELKLLLLAALKIGAPDFKLPSDKSGLLQQYVSELSARMQTNPMSLEALTKVVRKFIKIGENVDIKKWINAVELTACRAGFLLANDLEVAARMIQAEAGAVDGIPPKEKIKELVLFSVSERYFRLREALGINIGAS